MSKLIFFRHAQASFGADNYDALSEKGIEQTILLGKHLVAKKFKFDKIFVGPLQRQQHTFDIVKEMYAKNKVPMPTPILVDGFCLLYTSPSPRDATLSRMPSSA